MLVKPATEQVEADETASEVDTAAEAWRRHLLRNQSFIVDAFQVGVTSPAMWCGCMCVRDPLPGVCRSQGQYKSRVECPDCRKVSITFDPFMYLSGTWERTHAALCHPVFLRHASASLFPLHCDIAVPIREESALAEQFGAVLGYGWTQPVQYIIRVRSMLGQHCLDELSRLSGIPANRMLLAITFYGKVRPPMFSAGECSKTQLGCIRRH